MCQLFGSWSWILLVREIRAVDTVAFYVLEFPWLWSTITKGKPISALEQTQAHVQKYSNHVHKVFLMQFTEPCPIMAWSYHISRNTGFSINTWPDQGRRSWSGPGAIGTQHEHITTAELCEFEPYLAKVTGDLLTGGPTSWLQRKCSLVHQRVLCWLQMWFRLECGFGGTQVHCCWLHTGVFTSGAVLCSYRAIKSTVCVTPLSSLGIDGEKLAWNMATHELQSE